MHSQWGKNFLEENLIARAVRLTHISSLNEIWISSMKSVHKQNFKCLSDLIVEINIREIA